MLPFRYPFARSRSCAPICRRPAPRPGKLQLQLEALEERTLLNNRFVVPVGVPVDNATSFGTLAAALTTAGLAAGDVVQIEPGSTPGNLTSAILTAPAVANLTIQGDPAAALATIPQFTISEAVTMQSNQAGFTLRNVNVGMVAAGSIDFFDSVTIAGCSVTNVNSIAHACFYFAPKNNNVADVVANSTLTLAGPQSSFPTLVQVFPGSGTGCSDVFTSDLFVASNATGPNGMLLQYNSLGPQAATPNDLVSNCTFVGNAGTSLKSLFEDNCPASGLGIKNCSFSDPDPNVIGIDLDNSGDTKNQLTGVYFNTISLSGANAIGIDITGGNSGGFNSVVIRNNQISTSNAANGIGVLVNAGYSATTGVYVQAQANDFHNNVMGVKVIVLSTSANLTVDLGGGQSGLVGNSLGANNFRGLGAASASQGPIVVLGTAPVSPVAITARNEIFGSATATSFIGINNVAVDTANPLTGNAAFVESLYVEFLKRTGNTNASGDAFFWVDGLNSGSLKQADVVNGVCKSQEAYGLIVDALYQKILGRAADAGGRAALVTMLLNGGSIEKISTLMSTSAEFATATGSDAGFVQALYIKLLGRIGSNSEVANWVAQLPGMGRAAAANAILSSAEYRGDVVQQLYGFNQAPLIAEASLFNNILHRTTAPMASEIQGWVTSSLDALAIELTFLGTPEFYSNG
jgi:Domain of unknown function (DUF4214)